jgi:hypothetical protein
MSSLLQVVAIVPSCKTPLLAVISPSMQPVILGSAGLRLRDWGVMRALPPATDFAMTAIMNQELAEEQLTSFPYMPSAPCHQRR